MAWGWLKNLGKVASFALPFVPIPGLAGNVALSTAIRAGLGAATGAASGGKKGALIGAGLGSLPGLLGKAGVGGSSLAPSSDPGGLLAGASGSKGGIAGGVGKFLGGIDPTSAVLGGLSLLGGDEGPQERKSFSGSGRADPKFALNKALGLSDELAAAFKERAQARPVMLPELPAQIGGGLGADPGERIYLKSNQPVQRKKPEGM